MRRAVANLGACCLSIGLSTLASGNTRSILEKQCVAHRGYSAKFLENSMEAFEGAFHAGAKVIELDIHHTKEGIPIVHHDSFPQRTAEDAPGKGCPLLKKFQDLEFREIRDNCQLTSSLH